MGLNYLEGQKIYPRVDRRNRFVTNKALATILEFVMIQTTELIGRYPSGSRGETVNLLSQDRRRFESCPIS